MKADINVLEVKNLIINFHSDATDNKNFQLKWKLLKHQIRKHVIYKYTRGQKKKEKN